MAKSQATFKKKENEKKRLKKRNEKQEKREDRQASKKTLSFEDMMAYVDENGNLSSTPPDPKKKKIINSEDVQISISRLEDIIDEQPIKQGVVTFFNEGKGYGFIRNNDTQESIFVHVNDLITQVREGDKVTFEVEKGQKGPVAVRVSIKA